MEVWRFGGLEAWRFRGLEVWRSGGLEVWRFDNGPRPRHMRQEQRLAHGGAIVKAVALVTWPSGVTGLAGFGCKP